MHTRHDIMAREKERRTDAPELQLAVLRYLTEVGPAKWGALYGRFDEDRTGAIGSAMQRLAHCNHILVEDDGTAKITELGMMRLTSS